MKNLIEKRTKLLNDLKATNEGIIAAIQVNIKANTAIAAAIAAAENSTELGADEGGVYQWTRFDASAVIDVNDADQVEALQEYLSEFGATLDLTNDALQYNIGPCILVNQDGRPGSREIWVYDQDSQKSIAVDVPEGEEPDLRHACKAIEAYMDQTGCYPGVVLVDSRYGQPIRYINTQKEGN